MKDSIASTDATSNDKSLAWFMAEENKAAQPKNILPKPISAFDLCKLPQPPDWYRRDLEERYRKGYCHGFEEAVNQTARLYRKGYVRPTEIVNILANFCDKLHHWFRNVWHDDINKSDFSFGQPTLKQESWWDVRKATIERDGRACYQCGCTDNLEAHHLMPVSEGGLPELNNLLTLCRKCHRGGIEAIKEVEDTLTESESDALLIPLAAATGYQWDWYWGSKRLHFGCGGWQLMPRIAAMEDAFWDWHLDNRRQWFDDKHDAARSLLASYSAWQTAHTRQ